MFKVGDKVRCINPGSNKHLTALKVYTVTSAPDYGWIGVVANDGVKREYFKSRFELVDEDKPKRYFVSDSDEVNWDIRDSLDDIPDWADRVWELGDELVKRVTWEKKDA